MIATIKRLNDKVRKHKFYCSSKSPTAQYNNSAWQAAQLRRETERALKSVEILSAAAQLYVKSHLTRRIALSCGIKISPVGSLD